MAKSRKPLQRSSSKTPLQLIDISAKAEACQAKGDLAGAIQIYREWLATGNPPLAWVAQFNLGILLKGIGDLAGAEAAYRSALAQKPDFPQAQVNLGLILEWQGRPLEAIAEWEGVIKQLAASPAPDIDLLCLTLNNVGRQLEIQGRYTEASAALTRSLTLKPQQPSVIYHWIYLRQRQCEWPIYTPLPGLSVEDMINASSALAMLALTDDPELQLRAARLHAPKPEKPLPRLAPPEGYAHARLRIGYLSSNFGMHPVSFLTAELYELHDRSRFEVYGFCWSPEDGSQMRERIKSTMDHFVRIDKMTDEEAAHAIRNAEIDILIDLQGLTAGARPAILAYRPAPVQITYLGFPGTTALPEIDYVIADRYVIPEEYAHDFAEKPIYMPDCFQVNDRKRTIGPIKTRAEYGLPDDAFVFCAFNKNTKLNPEFFDAWLRILNRTPGSVLWLLADNDTARANLERYAQARGCDSRRLIFAPRVPPADYLARYATADLFLDLSPFNGGTTAADALWVGLPVLTCSGRSFASRMAGSLLNAIGLSELVTHTLQHYEDLAVRLATTEHIQLAELRERLKKNRDTTPLFDTPRFTRQLEDALVNVLRTAHPASASQPKPAAAPRYANPHTQVAATNIASTHEIAYKPNILLIRRAAIGDVILTTPVIRQVYADYEGNCHIDVVTAYPDVFSGNPWVRDVFSAQQGLPNRTYEKVINLDLAYERYPTIHIIEAYERVAFGIPRYIKNRKPMLFPSAADAAYMDEMLQPLGNRRFMVVHMRQGRWPSRNLPAATWRSVIEKIIDQTDLLVVEVGAETDLALEGDYGGRVINLFNRLSLQQLQQLIARSTLFFGIDSGTLHVAASTDTPIVCLFTSAHPDLRKPFRSLDNDIFIPVVPDIACYGCQARFPPPITGVICDQGDPFAPPCRDKFDVDNIVNALLTALTKVGHGGTAR